MFGLRKRIKALEREIGVVYDKDADFGDYSRTEFGTITTLVKEVRDLEERLSKIEESNPSKK